MKFLVTIIIMFISTLASCQNKSSRQNNGIYFLVSPNSSILYEKTSFIYTDEFIDSAIFIDSINFNEFRSPKFGVELNFGYRIIDQISIGAYTRWSFLPVSMSLGILSEYSPWKWLGVFGRIGYYKDFNYSYMKGLVYGGGLDFGLMPNSDKFELGIRLGIAYTKGSVESNYSYPTYTSNTRQSVNRYIFDLGVSFKWALGRD